MSEIIAKLPIELLVEIILFSTLEELCTIRSVCSQFYQIFNHQYAIRYFTLQRNELLGKYRNLTDIPYGIFRVLESNPSTLEDMIKGTKSLKSLKMKCWGNNRRGLCGIGDRDNIKFIYEKPLAPKFPPGERIWFICHSHETQTMAISLSGKVYCWGSAYSFGKLSIPDKPILEDQESDDDEEDQEDEKKQNVKDDDPIMDFYNKFYKKEHEIGGEDSDFTKPIEGIEVNMLMHYHGEIPIFGAVDHVAGAVLTNTGIVYCGSNGNKTVRVEVSGGIDRIISCNFGVNMLHAKSEEHSDGTKTCYFSHYEVYNYRSERQVTEKKWKMKLRKDEKVVKLESDYNYMVIMTNQNRLYEPQKTKQDGGGEFVFTKNGEMENVVDFSGARSRLIVTTDGRLYGFGVNRHGELGPSRNKLNVMGSKFYLSNDQQILEKKVIEVSNGTDYSTAGGNTMFMDEDRVLYIMGCNAGGEQFMKPNRSIKARPKKVPISGDILAFHSNENWCAVLVCNQEE